MKQRCHNQVCDRRITRLDSYSLKNILKILNFIASYALLSANHAVGSVASRAKALFLLQLALISLSGFKSLPGTLLRLWIKRFTIIFSAWWLWASGKFSGQEYEEIYRNIEPLEISKQVRIPPRTKYSHCNAKCADQLIVSVWRFPVSRR